MIAYGADARSETGPDSDFGVLVLLTEPVDDGHVLACQIGRRINAKPVYQNNDVREHHQHQTRCDCALNHCLARPALTAKLVVFFLATKISEYCYCSRWGASHTGFAEYLTPASMEHFIFDLAVASLPANVNAHAD